MTLLAAGRLVFLPVFPHCALQLCVPGSQSHPWSPSVIDNRAGSATPIVEGGPPGTQAAASGPQSSPPAGLPLPQSGPGWIPFPRFSPLLLQRSSCGAPRPEVTLPGGPSGALGLLLGPQPPACPLGLSYSAAMSPGSGAGGCEYLHLAAGPGDMCHPQTCGGCRPRAQPCVGTEGVRVAGVEDHNGKRPHHQYPRPRPAQ